VPEVCVGEGGLLLILRVRRNQCNPTEDCIRERVRREMLFLLSFSFSFSVCNNILVAQRLECARGITLLPTRSPYHEAWMRCLSSLPDSLRVTVASRLEGNSTRFLS